MKKNVYAIFDAKLEAHGDPLFARTHGEALRMFEGAVIKEGHQFNVNAEDYTLMAVGEWNDQTGTLENYSANIALGNALQVRAQYEERQRATGYVPSEKETESSVERQLAPVRGGE